MFTSREYDRESGLYFYRARYYDAELGRFISQDPIGISDDINLYNYVGGNPVNWADPLGLEKKVIVINVADENEIIGKRRAYNLLLLQLIKKYGDDNVEYFGSVYTKNYFHNIINYYKNKNIDEIVIIGHGTSTGIQTKDGDKNGDYDITSISEDYKEIKDIKSINMVRLYSCDTGKDQDNGSSGYAQQVASYLNDGKTEDDKITVKAPTSQIAPIIDEVLLGKWKNFK